MKEESRYIGQLKELIMHIQVKVAMQNSDTKDLLDKVAKLECPSKKERVLVNELIFKAAEYIELEQRINEKKHYEHESEMLHTYFKWFNSLDLLVRTFGVPLNKISFSDMSLKNKGGALGKRLPRTQIGF